MRVTPRIAMCLASALFIFCAAFAQSQSSESQTQAELKPAPPTPLAEQKTALGDDDTWDPDWDKIIESTIPNDLLSPRAGKDVRAFCPRFNSMADADKRAFWAYFFQALAGAEAGLRSTADVRHTEPQVAVKDGVSHRMVRAEGLLQLTFEDAERYDCDFDWDHDKLLPEHDPGKTILQPRNNLVCGVRILHNQLIDRHKPLLTKSSYWSTLRPGWPGYSVFIKQMSNVPPACGRRVRSRNGATVEANTQSMPLTSRASRSAFTSAAAH